MAEWYNRSNVARLRLTRDEMASEAMRLATAFVGTLPNAQSARCLGAHPETFATKSKSSKFPVVWTVVFVFHPPEVVMDGGELLVSVNLDTQTVALRE